MKITRRLFGIGITAFGMAACNGAAPPVLADQVAARLASDLRPVPNPDYAAWVAAFRSRAGTYGLSDATLSVGFRNTG